MMLCNDHYYLVPEIFTPKKRPGNHQRSPHHPLPPAAGNHVSAFCLWIYLFWTSYVNISRLNFGEGAKLSPSSFSASPAQTFLFFSPLKSYWEVSDTSFAYQATLVMRDRSWFPRRRTWPAPPPPHSSCTPSGALGMIGKLPADDETPLSLNDSGGCGDASGQFCPN